MGKFRVAGCIVKFDGIQEGMGLPDLQQWSIYCGPAIGKTLYTRSIEDLHNAVVAKVLQSTNNRKEKVA